MNVRKLLMNSRDNSPKNQYSSCQIKLNPFKLSVTHQNMPQEQCWCKLILKEINTLVLSFHFFFSEMERNFKIYDRELLAIIQALEEWQHYIQGSPCTTIIHSDHKTLTYYQEAQKLNWWQAWWYLYLSEFDVKMIHTPGPKMIQLDTLFHWPDFIPEKNTDNEDIIMLPENLFINLINLDLQWWIANTKDLDTDAMETLTMLLEQGSAMLRWELGDWTVKKSEGQNILFFKGKNYIHENDKLWWDITRMFHDHETAGHPRELKTYNTIWHHYWWLGLQTFVKNYMQGCRICQQFKTH